MRAIDFKSHLSRKQMHELEIIRKQKNVSTATSNKQQQQTTLESKYHLILATFCHL